jgi:hypothetical protein
MREHGPGSEWEISSATGLHSFAVRRAPDSIAKRGRDQKYSLIGPTL